IALAASLNANLGDAVVRTPATGSATVDIRFLPSSSDFNRALNIAFGRLRNSAAMRTNGSSSGPIFPTCPSFRAIICSSARFNCSIFFVSPFPGCRERLGIGTLHARPQTGQGPELQLLHSAFCLANLPRYFFDAFLFYEPQYEDFLLLCR